jgi:nucleoside-diphosphate-sugar epimerase
MGKKILLVGASGAIGRRLTLLLRQSDHRVIGTTRSEAKAEGLRRLGMEAIVVDVFDAAAASRALASAQPEVVINQLTDLPKDLDPASMKGAIVPNARVREEGTRNLVAAAIEAGARRFISQSIAWAYATGPEPHVESDPLDLSAEGDRAITIGGVVALENATLKSPPLNGVVLRYGRLYGPGTSTDRPPESAPLHVDAAAFAAFLAVDRGEPGAYNIVDTNAAVATDKAREHLKWTPDFRINT